MKREAKTPPDSQFQQPKPAALGEQIFLQTRLVVTKIFLSDLSSCDVISLMIVCSENISYEVITFEKL